MVLYYPTNSKMFLPIEGQDFFGPIVKHTNIPKHTIQRRMDNDVAIVDNYRIERTYFD
jgi:hypothetical protein